MEIPDPNLFMACLAPNRDAFRALPDGFHFRLCRKDELETWKRLTVEDEGVVPFVTEYFEQVYAADRDEFFARCLFVCNADDSPIGTCFLWRAYGLINTLHWLRVLPEYEGQGIGRALLTALLEPLTPDEYPIYLHTHPTSNRALGLYADLGFKLLTDPVIGFRRNDLEASLPFLQESMPEAIFRRLETAEAPAALLDAARTSAFAEF